MAFQDAVSYSAFPKTPERYLKILPPVAVVLVDTVFLRIIARGRAVLNEQGLFHLLH